jgi:hypothetical protein
MVSLSRSVQRLVVLEPVVTARQILTTLQIIQHQISAAFTIKIISCPAFNLENCFAITYFPSLQNSPQVSPNHTIIDPHDAVLKMGRIGRPLVQRLRRLLYPLHRMPSQGWDLSRR